MPGGKNIQHRAKIKGYTIIEVMIVLAISGVMFVIAATFINGKQQRTAFVQGSNELGAQIQSVIEDVTDGHFSDIPLSCDQNVTVTLSTGDTQGRNPNCVFLGKLIHFYTSASQPKYEVISLADSRSATGNLPRNTVTRIADLITQQGMPQSLNIGKMSVTDASGVHNNVNSIGFVQGVGTVDPDTGTYKSGSQTVSIVYSPNTVPNAVATDGTINGGKVIPASSATVCVTDGKRSADILIGGATNGGNELNITVSQRGNRIC